MWVFFFFGIIVNVAHESQISNFFITIYLLLGLRRLTSDGGASPKYVEHMGIVCIFLNVSQPSLNWFLFSLMNHFFLCPFICLTSSCEDLGHTDRTMTRASGVLVASSLKLGRFMSGHLCAKPLHMEISIFPKDIMSKTRRVMKKNDRYLEGNKQGLPLLSNSLKAS